MLIMRSSLDTFPDTGVGQPTEVFQALFRRSYAHNHILVRDKKFQRRFPYLHLPLPTPLRIFLLVEQSALLGSLQRLFLTNVRLAAEAGGEVENDKEEGDDGTDRNGSDCGEAHGEAGTTTTERTWVR